MTHSNTEPRYINLALQGGGSHGAFTWGVLDVLLSDPRLNFDAISGTSAGAVNAIALAHGFATAPSSPNNQLAREKARQSLQQIWQAIAGMGAPSSVARNMAKLLGSSWSHRTSKMAMPADSVSRWISPYQSNPLNINPLLRLFEQSFDFEAIAKLNAPQIFIAATHVSTGHAKIFDGAQLSAKALMASACLPSVFQAVEIEGEAYWDGGYSANPSLLPLLGRQRSRDIVVVQINPLQRTKVPKSAAEIMDRMNELCFNSSLLAQMQRLEYEAHLRATHQLTANPSYRAPFIHRVDDDAQMTALPASSKASTDATMIRQLFEFGVAAAQKWLQQHFIHLGQKSTIAIATDYGALTHEEKPLQ